jgi:flavin reductase (DIM6/NTAB) family NADH-FMN oxidoreductase RutF
LWHRRIASGTLTASDTRPDFGTDPPTMSRGGCIVKKSLGAKTILYPTPVLVVGTYDPQGKPNVMTAAWGGICCSQPPCVAVSLRKATYSYHNIVHRKAFTISVPCERYVKEADYFGIVSGKTEDKLAAAELQPVRSELVDAPYVQEFPLVLECRLLHTFELGSHTQFVGEILDVKVDQAVLGEGDVPDLEKLRPIMFAPAAQAYYGVGQRLGKAFSIGKRS